MTGARRVVVVTGGASGIGAAVVRAFAADGAAVISVDTQPHGHPDADTFVADVRVPQDNVAAVQHALDRFGRLDVLVGNAGVHDGGARIMDTEPGQLDKLLGEVFDVNVRGYVLGARAAAPALLQAHGCMIFTLSDASFRVRGCGAGIAYAVSKHAALGVVRSLAAELAPAVRVNGVAPGGIYTGLRTASGERLFAGEDELRSGVEEMSPLRIMLSPDAVAAAYVFLASAAARGMTGQVLRLDGGWSVL
jgi:2,3-dihydroxy-2,3-dihydrophenylpropionate dehydrogenase